MIKPIFWRLDSVIDQLNALLKMVFHYQSELQQYSDSSSPQQRRDAAETLQIPINQYCANCADHGSILPPDDIRLLFFLWTRLNAWGEFLSQYPTSHYLFLDDQFALSVPQYLLKPIQMTNILGSAQILSPEALARFEIFP